jgi:protein-tyrosine phosphatase
MDAAAGDAPRRLNCIAPTRGGLPCQNDRQPGSLFCRKHERAPAAQRGGWISAEKRRRHLAASQEHAMDASRVANRLWVGAAPPLDRDLPSFDVVVLCAAEIQPERMAFHGTVIRAPIPDATLDNAELTRALLASKAVGDALLAGRRVLVTCAQGLNRSALVASLALGRITRMSAQDLILTMRLRRHPQALFNQHFQEILRRIVGDGRR